MVTAVGHRTWLTLVKRATAIDADRLAMLSPILVIAPHQDDETLGCGGLLATASRLGLEPRVAYLTDGAASHVGSPSWSADRLARARRWEAIDALALLGVPSRDIWFMDWPDANPLQAQDARYARSLARLAQWARGFSPRSLWTPWPGERHCDHAAAARVAVDLTKRLEVRPIGMDYLVWGWTESGLAQAPEKVWALDCPQTVDTRRRALACHRTQTANLITDARTHFQIPPKLAALTERPTEVYLERA
jgi:LmbE family N-acetylglucosaminyl deacetylase